MSGIPDKTGPTQVVEFSRRVSGKNGRKFPKRLKAYHLSARTQKLIVEKFDMIRSHEDVAREFSEEIPGITGNTVKEVFDSWVIDTLFGRKPPASERMSSPGYRVVRGAA